MRLVVLGHHQRARGVEAGDSAGAQESRGKVLKVWLRYLGGRRESDRKVSDSLLRQPLIPDVRQRQGRYYDLCRN